MSSRFPLALKVKYEESFELVGNGSVNAKEELERCSSRKGYKKYVEEYTVDNPTVRLYCNKTLSMKLQLHIILEDITNLNNQAMAYLSTYSEHYKLFMLFELIGKTANIISWNSLNRNSYSKDFCRETRQLRQLINRAQILSFECTHTVMDKAHRAMEILHENITPGGKVANLELAKSRQQSSGRPNLGEVKIVCMEPKETLLLHWIDGESNELQTAIFSNTCQGFRIRFLRALIYCTRKYLELVALTINRVEVSVRTEFDLSDLEKCRISESQMLSHFERLAICKSKREFDSYWDDILNATGQFIMQLSKLDNSSKDLKKLANNPKHSKVSSLSPFDVIVQTPLLFKIVSEAALEEENNTSFDYTMSVDRTEDIFFIIQDMWSIDESDHKSLDMIMTLIKFALPEVKNMLSFTEQAEIKRYVDENYSQRKKVKKYLSKALEVFNHPAFKNLPIYNPSLQIETNNAFQQDTKFTRENDDYSESGSDEEYEDVSPTPLLWIKLPSGYDVTLAEKKEFLVRNQLKEINRFNEMSEDVQVYLTCSMIGRLYHYVATEACLSKIIHDRSIETKSLMKRLKPKERRNKLGVISIAQGIQCVKQTLRLMQNVKVLEKSIKSTIGV